jgi:hypothetical protein
MPLSNLQDQFPLPTLATDNHDIDNEHVSTNNTPHNPGITGVSGNRLSVLLYSFWQTEMCSHGTGEEYLSPDFLRRSRYDLRPG